MSLAEVHPVFLDLFQNLVSPMEIPIKIRGFGIQPKKTWSTSAKLSPNDGQCSERPKNDPQANICRNETPKKQHQAHSLIVRSIQDLPEDVHQMFPRGGKGSETPEKWQKNVEQVPSDPATPAKFNMNQVPPAFRRIYKKCLSSAGEHPSDQFIAKCIIDAALEKFPTDPAFKLAKNVALDVLNRKTKGVYTTKNVLAATAHCRELLLKLRKAGESSEEVIAKCFFNALVEMHPLKQYAVAALKKKANGFFDEVAKVCHDRMPKELQSRREINRYYFQCFIDTASGRYKNNLLVKFGRKWLEPYIDHPDSMFNREKILDIAEICEDKTKNFPPDSKRTAAFFCFFRSILSLHPSTKRLADRLIQWETRQYNQQKTDASNDKNPKTPERKPSSEPSEGSDASESRSILPILSRNGANKNQVALTDCMMNAVTSVPIASGVISSVSGLATKIPGVGRLFGNSSPPASTDLASVSQGMAQSFVQAATPCFQFFKRDADGKLTLDQNYAMGTALEVAKLNPAAALAICAAEAVADNVSVKNESGKQQYSVDYQGLAIGLGTAAIKSTKLGRLVGRFVQT